MIFRRLQGVRIGELLLERRALRPSELALALDEQARSGRRLCSLLITRGAIEFDDGARALGDQKGVPCALAKHLSNRDTTVAGLISAELGRASGALPIGRTTGGALIVAVRDPAPGLLATLQVATEAEIMMVVTPATRLEHLIAAQYGASPDEFDIDLDSAVDLAPAPPEPPASDTFDLDPDSIRLALSDLDDERVVKSAPSGSGSLPAASSAPIRVRSTLPPVAPTIDATRISLSNATSREAATDLAMAFVAGRWVSALVVAVRRTSAIGYRGHGIDGVTELELPLDVPSTIQRVVTSKQLSTAVLSSIAQDRLVRALRMPATIAAAPVLVASQVVAVIATGDSIHGIGDTSAPDELGLLAIALGDAYDRIRRS